MAIQGKAGWDMLSQKAMACLPSPIKPLSLQHCHQLMTKIQENQLYLYNGKQSQYNIDTVLETLAKMMHGESPLMEAFESNEFLKEVWSRFELLCTWQDPSSKEVYHGEQAINERMKYLMDQVKENKPLSLSDLDEFHIFPWLVDADGREVVDILSAKVYAAAGAAPSSSAAKAKRINKKQSGKDDAKSKKAKIESDSVLSLFG